MKHSSFWKVFGGCEIRFSIRGALQFWVRDDGCGVFELTGREPNFTFGCSIAAKPTACLKKIMKRIMDGVTTSVSFFCFQFCLEFFLFGFLLEL